MSPTDYTTISIPKQLFEKVQERIKGTGFTSVSRFVVFVLRELVMESKTEESPFSKQDKEEIMKKLEKLGYS